MLYQDATMTTFLVNILSHFYSFAPFPSFLFSQLNIDFLPETAPAPGRHSHSHIP
jgi:hypothetical protein